MNANELADYVDQINTGLAGNTFLPKAATMLRQQQAEIEELKILFDKTLNNWAKDMERNK